MPLQRHTFTMAVSLTLMVTMLAGCLGGEDTEFPQDNDDDLAGDTGRIEGRVLTQGLDEITGARLTLVADAQAVQEATTDENGRYALTQIEPGEYRLQTTAACCREDATRVVVTAGEVQTLDIMLTPFTSADLREPHVVEKSWEGFISCGMAVDGVVGVALCSFAEDPSEDFMLEFEIPEGIKTLSVGMTWDPAGGVLGQDFALLIENDDCDGLECSYLYAEPEGPPDLIVNINNDDITEDEWKWDQITDTRGLQFRVFTGGTNLVYQQPFSIYYEMHVYEEAPPDHNPIPDF